MTAYGKEAGWFRPDRDYRSSKRDFFERVWQIVLEAWLVGTLLLSVR